MEGTSVEYWLEVHRVGSVLFENIKVGDTTLKTLITSIIETPLLSDIECLTRDQNEEGKAIAPFTAWLLQGLLKAAFFHKLDDLREFYVDAQTKLLLSAYDQNLFIFKELVSLYVEGLEKILRAKTLNSDFNLLLTGDYPMASCDKNLTSIPIQVNSKREQVELAIILIEVIMKIKQLVLYHCTEIHQPLWNISSAIIASQEDDLKFTLLPFLSDMLKVLGPLKNINVMKQIKYTLPSMLSNHRMEESEVFQDCFATAWACIKKCALPWSDEVLRSFLKAKGSCSLKNFVRNEISFLLAQISNFSLILQIQEFETIALHEKIYYLIDFIVSELQLYLNHGNFLEMHEKHHPHSENQSVIIVTDHSKAWQWVLSSYQALVENNDPVSSHNRLESFYNMAKVCCMILGKLDSNLRLSKYQIQISFFNKDIYRVTEKILTDLSMVQFQYSEALEMAGEAILELLHLPEFQHVSGNDVKKTYGFMFHPFESGTFQLPGLSSQISVQNSSIPVYFLKSLQSVPPGAPVEKILTKFSKFASDYKNNHYLAVQSVKSVPFLFLSKKTSPSRLISDILQPAVTSQGIDIQLAVVDSIADVVCALAGTSYITRNQKGDLITKCCECTSNCEVTGTQGSVSLVETHLIKIIERINFSNLEVKRKFVDVLPRITMHTNILRNKNIFDKFLAFLRDEDEDLRFNFANCITSVIFGKKWALQAVNGQLNQDEIFYPSENSKKNEGALQALEAAFSKLEENIHLSLTVKNFAYMQQSLLETMTNIACFPVGKTLCKSIQLLLLFIRLPTAPIASIVLEVATAHKTTPLFLFYSFRPEISQFIGNFIVFNRMQYNQPLKLTLSEFIYVFKGLTDKRLVANSQNYVLPILILWIAKFGELKDLFYEWANYVVDCPQSECDVITGSLQNIYTYLLLTQPPELFNKCMSIIEELTQMKISQLLFHHQKAVVNQLLFNYQRNPDKVLLALQNVIGGSNGKESKQQMADKLESRFVGYLLFIVGKFVKELNVDSEKVHAIKSLTAVIKLMGRKHITPVARKVLVTLQTILTFNEKEYYDIQCEAWDVFIVTVDPNELGPLLATIVVSLLPFLNHLPNQIAKIFSYIIVENEKAVAKFLPSLVFLPEHPVLKKVNDTLKKHLNFEEEPVKDRLIRETSLILHETVGVRIEGLKVLQKTLKNHMPVIQNLIVGSDEPDPCIKTLLESLIQCCNDQDKTLSSLAASCLGELGAVDPGLLPREPKPKNELPISVHDQEFAYLALTEITKGFQNARNSVDMDAFALAIQELLKMYSISPDLDNSIWKRFSKQTQALMTPMLTSRYKSQDIKKSPLPDVIFGSKEVSTHLEWANLWASKLISFCKDDRAVNIFRACEPSLKRDTKVLLLFLQYILLHNVIRESAFHDVIIKEIEAVINWSPNNSESDSLRSTTRSVRLVDYCGYPNMRSTITIQEAQSCAMTVFLLIDFLQTWLRVHRETDPKRDYASVKDFLEKIDYLKISTLNYEMREYPRAIMYLEDVISKNPKSLSDHLPLLSKAYALYGDLDSVAGASTFQKTAPKMEDLLLSHQVSGQMEEVRIIYERLGKDGLMTPAHMQEMVQCYLNLGEPYTAYNCIRSFAAGQSDLMSILSEGMAESLIKLGDYTQLSKFLEKEENASQSDWFIQLGRIIVDLNEKENDVLAGLSNARQDVANALKQSHLQLGDFQQGYSCLIKFQILNEIERTYETILNARGISDASGLIGKLTEDWNLRSGIVQSDPNCLEPLMSMRRILLGVLKKKLPNCNENVFNSEIGRYWVKSAEIARKAKCFHQAYNCILNAEQFNIPITFIEKAQLFWDKGNQDQCLFTLNRGIKEFFPDDHPMFTSNSSERIEERKMCAEAKLLYAVYSEETSNCTHETNISNYERAYIVCRQLEKSLVFLAQCLDRVATHLEDDESELVRVCHFKIKMVKYFGQSLKFGYEYIYQTVPRMLSIWLDLGEKLDTEDKVNAMQKINHMIETFKEILPPFVLMTALPQLLSRLGHPNRQVFQLLKNILILLLKKFPQQCLWAFQVIAKSQVHDRVKRYKEVIQDPALRSDNLHKLINDFQSLCEKLNKLTNKYISPESAHRLKISSVVKELPQLIASNNFSDIIIPITKFCSISLPRSVTSSNHEPFPKQGVYIAGLEDEMTILHSLQRPRKILFRGSDGKLYDILCKPKDDLRRDSRLMEFNNIVNMYLHRDPESRARRLHIRTYMVVPLGENGGLLEWVPHLEGLRKILNKLYKSIGKYTRVSELKRSELNVRDPLEKKRDIFLKKWLPLHPPVFPEWFRQTFPDPPGWYIARQSYTRTTAVISMVGYILGLGDRHGENVLVDSESGDTVHVDFNCLFNQGERFDWKERVPFRLTHNMVAAMGPLGVEGTFRKSCEISLRVLRSQKKTLMSVLTPFAYDPFGSWGKNKEIVQNERDKKINEAFNELSDIEKRLNGSLRVNQVNSNLYLSVEGQVRSLILEATNIDNLCQMWFGWAPYL